MGDVVHATGSVAINPPLEWGDLTDKDRWLAARRRGSVWTDVLLVVTEESVDTQEGTLFRKSATRIVANDGESDMRDLEENIQEIVTRHGDRQFTGYIECRSTDYGDVWRVMVRDGKVRRVDPIITWPEG